LTHMMESKALGIKIDGYDGITSLKQQTDWQDGVTILTYKD